MEKIIFHVFNTQYDLGELYFHDYNKANIHYNSCIKAEPELSWRLYKAICNSYYDRHGKRFCIKKHK